MLEKFGNKDAKKDNFSKQMKLRKGSSKKQVFMAKITCVRKLRFCAGHRVLNHEGKCATAHGHNYEVHVTAEAEALNSIGMVIDFSLLKEKIGSWLETNWDHTFLVCQDDTQVIDALYLMPRTKEPFICPFNPTAENIALYLLHEICPSLMQGTGITITKVVVFESENCYAEAFIN